VEALARREDRDAPRTAEGAARDALGAAPSPEIHAAATHLLAVALSRQGRAEEALAVWDELLAAPAWPLRDELHWGRAQALHELGRFEGEADELELVVDDPRSPRRTQAALRAAQALERHGDEARARDAYLRFARTWPADPGAPAARRAAARLDGIERPAPAAPSTAAASAPPRDPLEAARSLAAERRYEAAVEKLEPALEELRGEGPRARLREVLSLLASCYVEIRREADAVALYDELRRLGGRRPPAAKMARIYALAGAWDRAEQAVEESLPGAGKSALWRALGDLRLEFGHYRAAYTAYLRALRGHSYLRAVLAPELAWSLFGMGRPERAVGYFRARRARSQRARDSNAYWAARALQRAGRLNAARGAFEELATARPYGYYGILAHSRLMELRGEEPPPAPGSRGSCVDPRDERVAPYFARAGAPGLAAPTVAWTTASLEGAFQEDARPPSYRAQRAAVGELVARWGELSPETRRAQAYTLIGERQRAIDELLVLLADLRAARKAGSYALLKRGRAALLDNRARPLGPGGSRLLTGGRYDRKRARLVARNRRALRRDVERAAAALGAPYARRRLAIRAGGGDLPVTGPLPPMAYEAFPLAFPGAVRETSRREGVPPYFLYGIMSVESGFHPYSVSVADAYGLLQVIPKTGRRLAEELGDDAFTPELLLEPTQAIRYGGHYLGRLLDKFRGQELLAAAAYNAGPHRVDTWLRANPNRPMDVFIEQIPYRQARGYARSVLEYVAKYRRVHHGEAHIYVSNALDPRALLQPNY